MKAGLRHSMVVSLGALWLALFLAPGAGFAQSPTPKETKAAAKSAKDSKEKKDPRDEPERLYEKAEKSLKKGYYDDSITEFEKLRNTYPFSKFAVEAELKIADARFKKKEYADAADDYRTFAKLHPKHEKVDYAMYRIGLSLFQESPSSVDRDQSSTEKALEEFRLFITQFPDSKYADDASKRVGQGRDRLAAKELYVGAYYIKHENWNAARTRLESVIARYPDSESAADAGFLLGVALFELKEKDAATATLTAYLEKNPTGEHARASRKMLGKLGVKTTPAPKATPTPKPTPEAAATPGSP